MCGRHSLVSYMRMRIWFGRARVHGRRAGRGVAWRALVRQLGLGHLSLDLLASTQRPHAAMAK